VGIGAQKLDTIESHPARLREDARAEYVKARKAERSYL